MLSIEDQLCPSAEPSAARDIASLALVAVLACILLPRWSPGSFYQELVSRMASVYLLPAMGFLLVLRRGGLDLSVWVNFALGGIVAAWAIRNGVGEAWALAIGAGSGLAVGLISAVLVGFARLPSVLVTPIVALAALLAIGHLVPAEPVLGDTAFATWHITHQQAVDDSGAPVEGRPADPNGSLITMVAPIGITRMLLVAVTYAAVMMVLMWSDGRRRGGQPHGKGLLLFAALATSGLLAACGGAFWLVESMRAPWPVGLVGDLRVPAAALLAGGVLLSGPGRAMLAGMLLPLCLVLTLLWQKPLWWMERHGISLELLVLASLLIVGQASLIRSSSPACKMPRWLLAAALLAGAAVLAIAAAGRLANYHVRDVVVAAAMSLGLIATGILLVSLWRGNKRGAA